MYVACAEACMTLVPGNGIDLSTAQSAAPGSRVGRSPKLVPDRKVQFIFHLVIGL